MWETVVSIRNDDTYFGGLSTFHPGARAHILHVLWRLDTKNLPQNLSWELPSSDGSGLSYKWHFPSLAVWLSTASGVNLWCECLRRVSRVSWDGKVFWDPELSVLIPGKAQENWAGWLPYLWLKGEHCSEVHTRNLPLHEALVGLDLRVHSHWALSLFPVLLRSLSDAG